MSNEAITWAYRQEATAGAKFVLVALADMADEDHSCYPGQAKLATMTGQSPRSVRRQLAELEMAGFITRKRRFDSHGHRTSDRYVLPVNEIPTGQSDQRPNGPVVNTASGQDDQRSGQPLARRGRPSGQIGQVSLRDPSVTTPQPPADAGLGTPGIRGHCGKHSRYRNGCKNCAAADDRLQAERAASLAAISAERAACSSCDPDGWAYDEAGEVTSAKCKLHGVSAGSSSPARKTA